MNVQFRPAELSEAAQISHLIDTAYAPQVRKLYGDSARGQWTHYAETRVATYLHREPVGVRVGLWEDRLITIAVCRSYGSLGWFHSVAVHPRFQHQGVGRQVMADVQTYLYSRGVETIGLITWPDAIANIGLYQSLGYRTAGLSAYAYRRSHLTLARAEDYGAGLLRTSLLSELPPAAAAAATTAAAALAHAVLPGLDYTAWLRWTAATALGDALLAWRDDHLLALALCYLPSHTDSLEGRVLLVSPDAEAGEIVEVLEALRRWAERAGRSHFGFPLDLSQPQVVDVFQQHDFRLFGESMINMLKGPNQVPQGIHLVRFVG